MNHTLARIYKREDIRGLPALSETEIEDEEASHATRTHDGHGQWGRYFAVVRGVCSEKYSDSACASSSGREPYPPIPVSGQYSGTVDLHRKNEARPAAISKSTRWGLPSRISTRAAGETSTAATAIPSIPSVMANGQEIADIVIKKMLKDPALVIACLTKKMLTYATGRHSKRSTVEK